MDHPTFLDRTTVVADTGSAPEGPEPRHRARVPDPRPTTRSRLRRAGLRPSYLTFSGSIVVGARVREYGHPPAGHRQRDLQWPPDNHQAEDASTWPPRQGAHELPGSFLAGHRPPLRPGTGHHFMNRLQHGGWAVGATAAKPQPAHPNLLSLQRTITGPGLGPEQ